MDFAQYKETFTKEALKTGYSQQNIQRCLDYAKLLFSRDLPLIYNPTHLSTLVGYKKNTSRERLFILEIFIGILKS
jgi:RNA-directed DNA polymerase